MTPRIATVLSARDWEAAVVTLARETATLRLVLRAYQPDDIARRSEEIDVVIAGAETSWVTPGQIVSWRRAGLRVLGLYPAGDRPARDLLEAAGVDEVLSDDVGAETILQAARFLRPAAPQPADDTPAGAVIAVTGGRGAPGRTEVAVSLAWRRATSRKTVLIDLDLEAPAVAIRLGLPPRPDITDVADEVRATGSVPRTALQQVGSLRVVVGSHRPGEPLLRSQLLEDVVDASKAEFEIIVLDLGPFRPGDRLLKGADHAVLVADGSATGLVRASRAAADWTGPPPALILDRVAMRSADDVVAAARQWTGLEPSAVVPIRPGILDRSRAARPPHRRLRRDLRRLDGPR